MFEVTGRYNIFGEQWLPTRMLMASLGCLSDGSSSLHCPLQNILVPVSHQFGLRYLLTLCDPSHTKCTEQAPHANYIVVHITPQRGVVHGLHKSSIASLYNRMREIIVNLIFVDSVQMASLFRCRRADLTMDDMLIGSATHSTA